VSRIVTESLQMKRHLVAIAKLALSSKPYARDLMNYEEGERSEGQDIKIPPYSHAKNAYK